MKRIVYISISVLLSLIVISTSNGFALTIHHCISTNTEYLMDSCTNESSEDSNCCCSKKQEKETNCCTFENITFRLSEFTENNSQSTIESKILIINQISYLNDYYAAFTSVHNDLVFAKPKSPPLLDTISRITILRI